MRSPAVLPLLLIALIALAAPPAAAQLIDSVRVDTDGATGQWTSLALDASENPHIAYFDSTNQRLRYASWNGTAFEIETVDTTRDGGMNCDLALDASGNPHVSYYAYSTNRDTVSLYYATRSGGAWTVEQVESGPADRLLVGSSWTSIAVGPAGPGIAYLELALSFRLKYAARGNGGVWGTAVADSTSRSGFEARLALDSKGTPHISHLLSRSDDGYEVRHTSLSNLVAWSSETVASVDSGEGDIGWSDIDLLAGDVPVIAYLWSNSYLLYVTTKTGPNDSWIESFYDTAGVGPAFDTRPLSLHVDGQNRVNVAYHHGPRGTLRYARTFHGIPFWVTVDENGTVGEFNAISVDDAEVGHLSYYDTERKDLKYATAGIRLDGITAIPAIADMLVDSVRALSAQADFRSGFVDITFNAFWNSRDESIARVDSFGFVRAVRAGSTYVVADFDVYSDSVLIRVDDPDRVAVQLDYTTAARTFDLVSFPLEPETPGDDVFATMFASIGASDSEAWKVGRWDPGQSAYATLNGGGARSAAGEGYWFVTEDPESYRSPRGFHPGRTIGIALENGPGDGPGWNQLGMPHDGVLDVDDILVTDGADTLALTDPGNNWTERSVTGWVNDNYAELGDLRTGRGFWIRKLASEPVTVLLPFESVTDPAIAPPRGEEDAKHAVPGAVAGWRIALRVSSADDHSNEVVLGAGPFAPGDWIDHAKALPPAPPGGAGALRLAIRHDDRGRWNGLYRESRLSESEPLAWTLVIERDADGPSTATLQTTVPAAGGASEAGSSGALGGEEALVFEWQDPNTGIRGTFVSGDATTLALHGSTTEYRLTAKRTSDDVPEAGGPAESIFRFAYPNPFRQTSGFRFRLGEPTDVTVTLYNLAGREVRSLRGASRSPGEFVLVWDGRDARGESVPPGVYLARLEWAGHEKTARVVRIR